MAEEISKESMSLEAGLDAATGKALEVFLNKEGLDKEALAQYLRLEQLRHTELETAVRLDENADQRDHAIALENLKFEHARKLKEKEFELTAVQHDVQWVREKDLERDKREHAIKLKEMEIEAQRSANRTSLITTFASAGVQLLVGIGTVACALRLSKHNDEMLAESTEKWMKFAAGEDAMPGDFRNAKLTMKNPLDLLKFRR